MKDSLAILMTCHNRKQKTLACLQKIEDQLTSEELEAHVFLVDDGCTDGTAEAVSYRFPRVNIIRGDGTLFWNGGMRQAFSAAMERGYQFYLWLNDDVLLYSDAFDRLFVAAEKSKGIIVGSMQDPETKKQTYGGVKHSSVFRPLKFESVVPDESLCLECDTINGNCVLIPRWVVNELGNLNARYTHAIGDFDYGLRAKKIGIKSWVAPGYFGACETNPLPRWCNPGVPLQSRLKELHGSKGLPPKEWIYFAKNFAPLLWPLYAVKLYIKALFCR